MHCVANCRYQIVRTSVTKGLIAVGSDGNPHYKFDSITCVSLTLKHQNISPIVYQ